MCLFGIIVPPVHPLEEEPSEPQDDPTQKAANWPKFLIVLDNDSYKVLDLTKIADSENRVKNLATIHTGTGGYMPRYLTQVVDEGHSFHMVTLC